MNCKPGDLARIVNGGKLTDRLVHVLSAAPKGRFNLPDGYPTAPVRNTGGTYWICESAGSHFDAQLAGGGNRKTRYGVIEDQYLRPIRDPGEDAKDESLNWLPVPSQHKEVA